MDVDLADSIIRYLSNELMWECEWSLKRIAVQTWAVPFFLLLLLRKTDFRVHRNIYLFSVVMLLGEHISSDQDWKMLWTGSVNAPYYHLFTPLYFYFLCRFYQDYLWPKKKMYISWALPLAFLALAIWNAKWGDGFYNFPSVTAGVYSLAGILLPISYFWKVLNEMKIERLEKDPMFWVATGCLLYYSGSFLLWFGLKLLAYDRVFFESVYDIGRGLTIFLNICLVIAILLEPPPP